MTSFQISVSPSRRAASRFVNGVRRKLQRAYASSPEISQTDIANALGVHRSVINRQLRGHKDMTLSRVAELAWALGFDPRFELQRSNADFGSNTPADAMGANPFMQISQYSNAFQVEPHREGNISRVRSDA